MNIIEAECCFNCRYYMDYDDEDPESDDYSYCTNFEYSYDFVSVEAGNVCENFER